MWFGISRLHDVGGVGAEHHQLAVRHVDDAHDAEGDRQADGDEHQHRAEAEAEEQRLDAGVERPRTASMRCDGRAPRRADVGVGLGEAAVRRLSRASAASRLRTSGLQPMPTASAMAASRAAGSPPSSAASARPVSISRLHAGVGSRCRSRSRSSAMRRVVERAQHLRDGVQPHRRVRVRQREARDRRPAARVAGGCSCRSRVSSSRGGGAGVAAA